MGFISRIPVVSSIVDLASKQLFRLGVQVDTIAAAGSTQADAAILTAGKMVVTAADGTKGVLLPPADLDMTVTVVNDPAAANTLKVWPAKGDAINALGADQVFSQSAGASTVFMVTALGQWYANSNATGVATTATTAELNAVADASVRFIANTATSLALTVTQHADHIVLMNASGTTNIVTLPAATGSGVKFTVLNNFAQTQGTIALAVTGTDVMLGIAVNIDNSGAGASKAFAATATDNRVTLNRTTTGAAKIGDLLEVWDTAANVWTTRVNIVSSGSLATPFSHV